MRGGGVPAVVQMSAVGGLEPSILHLPQPPPPYTQPGKFPLWEFSLLLFPPTASPQLLSLLRKETER